MWIRHLSDYLDKITRIVVMILLGVMFLIVFGNAVLRYLFEFSFVGSYDYSRILFIWTTFFGASVVYKQKGHPKFDFLHAKTRGVVRFAVDLLINLLVIGFLVIIMTVGTRLTYSIAAQTLPASGVSAMWLYLPIIIASAIMLIHAITFLLYDFLAGLSSRRRINGAMAREVKNV